MFDQLKGYTGAELKALVRMVEETERALIEADAESRTADLKRAGADQAAIDADLKKRFKLLHLHGAGAAAQALLKVRLPLTRVRFWETWRRPSETSTRLSAPLRRPSLD
jgi:hypothetical protein